MFLSPCYERCTSPRTSLFFFFNDTATTEIYTLSLHDALPICDRLSRALRAIAQWCRQHRHAPISWQHAVLSRDRKSTRLNSSHDQISYAVFCLKKKKEQSADVHRCVILLNVSTLAHVDGVIPA